MRRLKQALFIAMAAALLFTSGMLVQSTRADPQVTPAEFNEFFLEAVQLDFICTNVYTSYERHVYSIPLVSIFQEEPSIQASNFGFSLCTSVERLKIMFSINPYLLMNMAN